MSFTIDPIVGVTKFRTIIINHHIAFGHTLLCSSSPTLDEQQICHWSKILDELFYKKCFWVSLWAKQISLELKNWSSWPAAEAQWYNTQYTILRLSVRIPEKNDDKTFRFSPDRHFTNLTMQSISISLQKNICICRSTFCGLHHGSSNRTVRNKCQCWKTTVLNYHRCLINTGVENMNNI